MRFSITAPIFRTVPVGLAALLMGRPVWAAPADAPTPPASASAPATSATPALKPDRPGFTNGSDTVLPGRVQLEGGLTVTEAAADGGAQTTDGPGLLARFGLTPTLELRVELPDYSASTRDGPSGFGDSTLGAKFKVYQSRDGSTKVALTPAVSVPTGAKSQTSGHADPLLTLGAQTESGARWSIEANLTLSDPYGDGGASSRSRRPAR